MPAVILIHFWGFWSVYMAIWSLSRSERQQTTEKSVWERCFGKTFRAAVCPQHDTEGNAYQEKTYNEIKV